MLAQNSYRLFSVSGVKNKKKYVRNVSFTQNSFKRGNRGRVKEGGLIFLSGSKCDANIYKVS